MRSTYPCVLLRNILKTINFVNSVTLMKLHPFLMALFLITGSVTWAAMW